MPDSRTIAPRNVPDRRVFARIISTMLDDAMFGLRVKGRVRIGESPGWSSDGALIGELEIIPPREGNEWVDPESYPIYLTLRFHAEMGVCLLHWRCPVNRYTLGEQTGIWPKTPVLTLPKSDQDDHDVQRDAALAEFDRRWDAAETRLDNAGICLGNLVAAAGLVRYWIAHYAKKGPDHAAIATTQRDLESAREELGAAMEGFGRMTRALMTDLKKLTEGHAPAPPAGRLPYWSFDPDPSTVQPGNAAAPSPKDPLDSEAFG